MSMSVLFREGVGWIQLSSWPVLTSFFIKDFGVWEDGLLGKVLATYI